MISGLFRSVIWKPAVPNNTPGGLSCIAMISYLTGPLPGNARAGWVAAQSSVSISLWSGGVACVFAVVAASLLLPKSWIYRAEPTA